ncbi:MAG: phenylacetate--CoA ligase family protein [Egibacteraceae bacterium]
MTTVETEAWVWPPRYDNAYQPPDHQQYWFPRRETMPAAERDERIVARIRQVMEYAAKRSRFYRQKWEAVGVRPSDIRTLGDFEAVPPVTKDELRRQQAEHPPFGEYLCVPEPAVGHVHGTSGTTGRPTAFGIGRDDWNAIANAHARVMWAMGVRPFDTVFIASFFSLYMGSWGALIGAERLGARVFPFGAGVAGQTLRAVNWLRQMRPTVFYGTPSYALHLAEVAQEQGLDPREFGVRILFFSGEPGASVPVVRERIEQAYGGKVFDSGSMAEISPWMNLGESSAQAGMLCWQDIVYTEVVDPGTYRRVPYGGEGTPLYTHLERTSQPMIRLLSGDLTRWEEGPSPCGRTYPVLPRGIYGRIDDMLTVRGENIFPSAVNEVLMAMPGYGGEHCIIVSRREAMDELTLRVEHDEALQAQGEPAVDRWRGDVASGLRTVLGVGAKVIPLPPGSLERTEFKARRVVDDRDLLQAARTEASNQG